MVRSALGELAHHVSGPLRQRGRLPVNSSGGLKARGHPLAATGISQLVELCWQLTGRAEGRQVEAHVGLAQSIGGLATNNWVTLLEGRR
jgi:acetyl-CoA C-acetyltransferase